MPKGNAKQRGRSYWSRPARLFAIISFFCVCGHAQDLTTLGETIQKGTIEQKRDALFQIRNLRSESSSRIALPALKDDDPIVRATAASSIIFLPPNEAVDALAPMLHDRDEFVRRESAYALGLVESSEAAFPLMERLKIERDLEVKSATVVALGRSGNLIALKPLTDILRLRPDEDTEFLRRAAARSIGQIAQIIKNSDSYVVTPQNFLPEKFKDISGEDLTERFPDLSDSVGVLIGVLRNNKEANDVRREAAFALGIIGSRSAIDSLAALKKSDDPYLSEISEEALLRIKSRYDDNGSLIPAP